MELVIDANVVISALIADSKNARITSLNRYLSASTPCLDEVDCLPVLEWVRPLKLSPLREFIRDVYPVNVCVVEG